MLPDKTLDLSKVKLSQKAQDHLSTMHITQVSYVKALALKQVLRDQLRELEKTNHSPEQYRALATEYQEAIELHRLATQALLTYGLEYAKLGAIKHSKPFTKDLEALYTDKVENYMMTDLLPDWWQSKLIDLIMRTSPRDVGMTINQEVQPRV